MSATASVAISGETSASSRTAEIESAFAMSSRSIGLPSREKPIILAVFSPAQQLQSPTSMRHESSTRMGKSAKVTAPSHTSTMFGVCTSRMTISQRYAKTEKSAVM